MVVVGRPADGVGYKRRRPRPAGTATAIDRKTQHNKRAAVHPPAFIRPQRHCPDCALVRVVGLEKNARARTEPYRALRVAIGKGNSAH
jgi:hypothetical protein